MLTSAACNQADDEAPGPIASFDAAVLGGADAATSPAPGAGGLPGAGAGAAGGATLGGVAGGGTTGGAVTGGATAGAAGTMGGATSGATPGGTSGGGMPGGNPAAPDAGAATMDSGPPMLTLPGSSVPCAGSPCDTLINVCCESWSTTGFGMQQSCIPRNDCNRMYSRDDPASNRVVSHACDGVEDCAGGQVCCFIADGRPLCDIADILECNAKVIGPGGGRICAPAANCVLGAFEFIGEGVPLGALSCNDDGDCRARQGTSCQAEQDNSVTTGKGVMARNYIKVCR